LYLLTSSCFVIVVVVVVVVVADVYRNEKKHRHMYSLLYDLQYPRPVRCYNTLSETCVDLTGTSIFVTYQSC
jgi:hypothetical protein